jgi:hypothetical protein
LSTLALAGGPTIAVEPSSSDAAGWLREFFGPALAPAEGAPEWMLRINQSDGVLARTRSQIPADADLSPCYSTDTQFVALRAHRTPSVTLVDDMRRKCALRISPPTLELVAAEGTCRWRIVPIFVLEELAAARLRHTRLELHAAGVEVGGSGIAVVGPKGAGKTSLSIRLLRSDPCRYVCNDRAFAGIADGEAMLWGLPTGVTLPLHLTSYAPELDGNWVDRPYLYTLEELRNRPGSPRPAEVELWLGPHQLAERLGAERAGSTPLRVFLFPRFRPQATGWQLERIAAEDVGPKLLNNIYGDAVRPREASIFEALEGGVSDPPAGVAEALAGAVPAFGLEFGPDAWASENFPVDLLDALDLR